MKKVLVTVALVAASLVLPSGGALAGGQGGNAVPAGTEEFAGPCTATFVRSSSGIINETDRECAGDQNPWVDADVWIQFRPLDGRPNPECETDGLVASGQWTETQYALNYFEDGKPYNYCVYLVDPVVASGSLNSADADGVSLSLLTFGSGVTQTGRYRIDIADYWDNGPYWGVDAEYVEQSTTGGDTGDTSVLTWLQGWPSLGEGFGDVLVNSSDINWGNYTSTHAYSYTGTFGTSLTLAVSDTYHGDNVGSLSYTITYLGH